jgi:hypothetical protein
MAGLQIWRHVPGKVLLFLINLVAATALIFEGEREREFLISACRAPSISLDLATLTKLNTNLEISFEKVTIRVSSELLAPRQASSRWQISVTTGL